MFVNVGIDKKTVIIFSPNSLALSIMATPSWFSIVMLLLSISDDFIVSGKLSIIGLTVYCMYGCIGANTLYKKIAIPLCLYLLLLYDLHFEVINHM